MQKLASKMTCWGPFWGSTAWGDSRTMTPAMQTEPGEFMKGGKQQWKSVSKNIYSVWSHHLNLCHRTVDGSYKNLGVLQCVWGSTSINDQWTSQEQCKCQLTLPCILVRIGRSNWGAENVPVFWQHRQGLLVGRCCGEWHRHGRFSGYVTVIIVSRQKEETNLQVHIIYSLLILAFSPTCLFHTCFLCLFQSC